MPNPTTKPKPSPKPPPVCKKGPPKTAGPAPTPDTRYLTALIGGDIAETGLPAAINLTITLSPLAVPYTWQGLQPAGDARVELGLYKNPLDDNYSVEIEYYVGTSLFFSHEWADTTPKRPDPLEFSELTYQDPLTNNAATVTIMS